MAQQPAIKISISIQSHSNRAGGHISNVRRRYTRLILQQSTDSCQQSKWLIESLNGEGKLIAAVCHGQAGLLNARNTSGEPLIKGRKVTGFANTEERLVGLRDVVPFLLEDAVKERGGDFGSALLPTTSHTVRDGNLLTGQNPASS